MSDEKVDVGQDKWFRIKYSDREYIVMTHKMHHDALLDRTKGPHFLVACDRGTVVDIDPLYVALLKMVVAYKREEITLTRADVADDDEQMYGKGGGFTPK